MRRKLIALTFALGTAAAALGLLNPRPAEAACSGFLVCCSPNLCYCCPRPCPIQCP
jgi:hypothetical protein